MTHALRRNISLLYLTFLATILMNVLPQQYFATHEPEKKAIYLSSTLLVCAIIAISAVFLANKNLNEKVYSFVRYCFFPAISALAIYLFQFESSNTILYMICHFCLVFCINFSLQISDTVSSAVSNDTERKINDTAGTTLRFVGMFLGPLYMGFGNPDIKMHFLFLIILCVASQWGLSRFKKQDATPLVTLTLPTTNIPKNQWYDILSSIGIYGSYCILASTIMYMLSDFQSDFDPKQRAGLLISVVYAGAFATAILINLLKVNKLRALRFYAPFAMLGGVGMLRSNLGSHFEVQIAVSAFLGAGFSCFLIEFRNSISKFALQSNDQKYISIFNSVPNYSALFAFFVLAAIAVISPLFDFRFTDCVYIFLLVFSLILVYFVGKINASQPC